MRHGSTFLAIVTLFACQSDFFGTDITEMAENNEDAKFEADLEAKLKLLTFTRDKTEPIIEGSNTFEMDRQLKALNALVDEVDTLRRSVEQSKFKKGEEPESVPATCGKNLDGEISKTDAAITTLTSAISEVRSNQVLKERQLEHALREKKGEEQLLFEKRHLNKNRTRTKARRGKNLRVKLMNQNRQTRVSTLSFQN